MKFRSEFVVSPQKRGKLLIQKNSHGFRPYLKAPSLTKDPARLVAGGTGSEGSGVFVQRKKVMARSQWGPPSICRLGGSGRGGEGVVNQHGTNKKLHSAVPPRTTPSFSIEMRPEKDKCRSLSLVVTPNINRAGQLSLNGHKSLRLRSASRYERDVSRN